MNVESNYAIAIATLITLIVLKLSRQFFKTDRNLYTWFSSRVFSKLQIIPRNSDWFMMLFAPFVIGWSNTLVLVFRQSFETSLCITQKSKPKPIDLLGHILLNQLTRNTSLWAVIGSLESLCQFEVFGCNYLNPRMGIFVPVVIVLCLCRRRIFHVETQT